MTCIVGLVHDGRVTIGGDSAGIEDRVLVLRKDPKVFLNGPFVIGVAGSFRVCQVLRYQWVAPEQPKDVDIDTFMRTEFIDSVATCLKGNGAELKKNASDLLVGYCGRLFEVSSDYQVGELQDAYATIGSGAEVARGAMWTLTQCEDDDGPDKIVEWALQAAEAHCVDVRGPFVIETTGGKKR